MNVFLRYAVFALFVAHTAPATAQPTDDERARVHFQAGTSYFSQGRYIESGEQYDEAYALSMRPALLANAALAYERGGDLALAIERLEAFLASNAPEAEASREENTARLERLRAALALMARATADPGHAPAVGETSSDDTSDDAHRRRRRRRAGLVTGGIGIAIGGASLGLWLASKGVARDLDAVCGPTGDACPPDRADDIDRGRTMSSLSAVMLGASLTSIATGTTLYLLGRGGRRGRRATTTALTVDVARGGLRFDVARAF